MLLTQDFEFGVRIEIDEVAVVATNAAACPRRLEREITAEATVEEICRVDITMPSTTIIAL